MTDYVPECREAGGWDGVTFEHLLDMATGRYDSAETDVDEDASNTSRFFLSTTHAEKIAFSCTRLSAQGRAGRALGLSHVAIPTSSARRSPRGGGRRRDRTRIFSAISSSSPCIRRLGMSPEIATSRRTLDDGVAAVHRLGPRAPARRPREARRIPRESAKASSARSALLDPAMVAREPAARS